ncbi:NADH:ubiquinone oxidoreductase, membrane subunit J [Acidithiobacillus ferrivorans]|uniref:NADH-quinone oxidoreductase subunit J n=1 Tax=Acidithiobacillus ferrivorans TaxID=160808 RepID=A0A060UT39_9PROT|nr:NADH-quinone oxidoreductase subunit J [Acidithiobacillus ferrivorans]MBU2852114.1 NADH-quinone oxidoreductase subunit J [Acidithiobacillus ferrivorans]CDQ11797.1 NADH:ubiquinone oxidoreductase, membrane subunit J [Acidithiobacillus ferrivorans]SMH65356.1 NADH:ubiquinone oxidoreductase, membrane subunit J [Acidithiobacillus ferrivorans]
MEISFYIASIVAVLATVMVITGLNAIHALLYFVVSLLAVAVVFYILGAPFIAALEVIVYAGAIVVLFVFVVMMLNIGKEVIAQEWRWLTLRIWVGPTILSSILFIELIDMLSQGGNHPAGQTLVGPKAVGVLLFGPYLLAVEIASMLLLAGLVGAYRIAQPERKGEG